MSFVITICKNKNTSLWKVCSHTNFIHPILESNSMWTVMWEMSNVCVCVWQKEVDKVYPSLWHRGPCYAKDFVNISCLGYLLNYSDISNKCQCQSISVTIEEFTELSINTDGEIKKGILSSLKYDCVKLCINCHQNTNHNPPTKLPGRNESSKHDTHTPHCGAWFSSKLKTIPRSCLVQSPPSPATPPD